MSEEALSLADHFPATTAADAHEAWLEAAVATLKGRPL